MLAILLDQRVRGENIFRTIFLYPLAVSFVVTGTVWSWLLNPGFGVPKMIQQMGWTSFHFDWLVRPDRAIYTIIIAGVWQGAGFTMALFLAGPALGRRGSRQGRADRRGRGVAHLSPRRAADDLADRGDGASSSCSAIRDQAPSTWCAR